MRTGMRMLHDAKLRAQLAFVHAHLSHDKQSAVNSAITHINLAVAHIDGNESERPVREAAFRRFDAAINQLLFCGYIVTETEGA